MQLNDCRFTALRDQGFTGQTNDMLLQWLQFNGATSDCLPDAWSEMLVSKGLSPVTNDSWYALLGVLGYEGQINDREIDFWCDGGEIPLFPAGDSYYAQTSVAGNIRNGWAINREVGNAAMFVHDPDSPEQGAVFAPQGSDIYRMWTFFGGQWLILARGTASGSQDDWLYFIPPASINQNFAEFEITDFGIQQTLTLIETGELLRDEFFDPEWWVNVTGGGSEPILWSFVPLPLAPNILTTATATILTTADGEILTTDGGGGMPSIHVYMPNRHNFIDYGELSETAGEVQLLGFNELLTAGQYEISVSIIAEFNDAGDDLFWRVSGSFPSPAQRFMITSSDSLETVPEEYSFQMDWPGGQMIVAIWAEIEGTGVSTVDLPSVNIDAHRLSDLP